MDCVCSRKDETWKLDPSSSSTLKLSSVDQQARFNVTTVTYYDGEALPVKVFLQDRVAKIVRANPWLGGTLVKEGGQIVVKYSPDDPHPDCFARVVSCPSLWSSKNYGERLRHNFQLPETELGMPATVPETVGTSRYPLFKVILATESEAATTPKRFAILFHMNHIIGDGHTMYTIYKMLRPSAEVVTLKAERFMEFGAQEADLVGGFEAVGACTVGILRNTIFKPQKTLSLFEIDIATINARKLQLGHDTGVPFVSTNDVLSAAFFKATEADVSFMAVNLRNRVVGVDGSMAGNYESVIYYMPDDVSPALLRKSLTSQSGFRRAAEPATEIPGFFTLTGGRLSMISTWASFYGDVSFENCVQTMHMPLGDFSISPFEYAQIWCPGGSRLALACGMRPESEARLRAELGDALKSLE